MRGWSCVEVSQASDRVRAGGGSDRGKDVQVSGCCGRVEEEANIGGKGFAMVSRRDGEEAAVVGVRFSGSDWRKKAVRDSELEEEKGFSSPDAAQGRPALGCRATRLTCVRASGISGPHPARPGLDLARLGSPMLA
ncbi:hypothetical protein LXL04_032939 [Taraxacum kok-saghyz]